MIILEEGKAYEVLEYELPHGGFPFSRWMDGLDAAVRARVDIRVQRFALGQFGPYRHLGAGLFEAKTQLGAGIRVYFGVQGGVVVVLLFGGDKRRQSQDIDRARGYWMDFKGGRP